MEFPAIETHGLTRRFGPITAVDDVALAVPARSVYAFLGLNGAGKTTTIRLLLGLQRPTRGEVVILGRPIRTHRIACLQKVAALVETPSLYPHLTGRENLEVVRRILGVPAVRSDEALRKVGLAADGRRLVREYSLGMRQRLGLAQCLLGSPQLLVLDEPTNGLDPEGIQEVRDLIRALPSKTGTTVFLSSHILAEVEQTATHVGVIHRGRLLFQGAVETLPGNAERILEVGVHDPQRAVAVLSDAGWEARATERGRIMVPLRERTDASRINGVLVAAGLDVSHLAEAPRSLEGAFFGLIGGDPDGRAA
jgi:ABC-2 type transport system ATP-binding protein